MTEESPWYMTRDERTQIQEILADRVLNGMDYKSLVTYVHEQLMEYYTGFSDVELTHYIRDHYPELLEE